MNIQKKRNKRRKVFKNERKSLFLKVCQENVQQSNVFFFITFFLPLFLFVSFFLFLFLKYFIISFFYTLSCGLLIICQILSLFSPFFYSLLTVFLPMYFNPSSQLFSFLLWLFSFIPYLSHIFFLSFSNSSFTVAKR